MFGRDLAWKYCSPIEENQNETICNYCGLLMESGGITCFKYYLANRDPQNNTKKHLRVLSEVKEEIRDMLYEKTKAKTNKTVMTIFLGTINIQGWWVCDKDREGDLL